MASLARRLTRSSRELQEAELHKMIVSETPLQNPPPNTQTSPPPRRGTLRKGEARWRYSVTITNPLMIGAAGEGSPLHLPYQSSPLHKDAADSSALSLLACVGESTASAVPSGSRKVRSARAWR